MSVNDYVTTIQSSHKLPAEVEAAAKSQAEAAQHVGTGKQLPAEIIAAAKSAGWIHPTLAPPTVGSTAASIGAASIAKGGKGGKPKARRDLSERDAEPTFTIEERYPEAEAESEGEELYARDAYPESFFDKRGAYPEAYYENYNIYARDAEALPWLDEEDSLLTERALSHEEVKAMLDHMESDPKAEQLVSQAIASDPDVENFAEGLLKKWKINKRSAYAKAEAEAEANAYYGE
ncbi:hypothetical protein MMC17_002093 [Xylographa soralifera]|nr:hypothetical protein [Xylographa soralifera]